MRELAEQWAEEAGSLERWGDARGAAILRQCAQELERALHEHADIALTIAQAADESGYSRDHLRALVSTGDIPNAGRKGSPKIRRRDLPLKPGGRGT